VYKKAIIFITIFIFSGVMYGQVKIPVIMTDRPDFTESPITITKGYVQIETGLLYTNEKLDDTFGSIENNRLSVLSTLVRVGLTDFFELRLGGEYLTLSEKAGNVENSSSGLNALLIGGKIQFLSSE
jgi:hypothetical protein